MDQHSHNALAEALIRSASARPTRCTECGGYLEEEERPGLPCGLCFPLMPSHLNYLAAFDSWLYARSRRDSSDVRWAEGERERALGALMGGPQYTVAEDGRVMWHRAA